MHLKSAGFQKFSEIYNLRFRRAVFDNRIILSSKCSHNQILGRPNAGVRKRDFAAAADSAAPNCPFFVRHLKSQFFQAVYMYINRAFSDSAAARSVYRRLSAACQQASEQKHR